MTLSWETCLTEYDEPAWIWYKVPKLSRRITKPTNPTNSSEISPIRVQYVNPTNEQIQQQDLHRHTSLHCIYWYLFNTQPAKHDCDLIIWSMWLHNSKARCMFMIFPWVVTSYLGNCDSTGESSCQLDMGSNYKTHFLVFQNTQNPRNPWIHHPD